MTSYAEALARLSALGRLGVRPGLETTAAALARLGHPEARFPSLHIAGTNGKGSTAAFAEAMLRAAGARTGLYTSPHLVRYTERIRIDGEELDRARLVELAARVLAVGDGLTFFEAATVIAFLSFAEAQVDVAVVECGLGGRLDATNLCHPLATVVTGIAFDHQELLGDTLGAIAFEKAGIFKPGVPALVGALPAEAMRVVEERARAVGAPLDRLGEGGTIRASLDERGRLSYDGPGGALAAAHIGLVGAHQASNAALALAAVSHAPARARPDEGARRRGLAEVRWPGRVERLAPDLWVDAAHNPDGARALVAALPGLGVHRPVLVVGALADKDVAGILAPLVGVASAVVCCAPPSPRALGVAALAAIARSLGAALSVEEAGSVEAAVARGRQIAAAEGGAEGGRAVVACGSIFLVGAVRRIVTGEEADPVAVSDPAGRRQG